MSEVSLFHGNVLATSDLFKSLQDTNTALTGGSAGKTRRRISVNGGKFREMVNGEQVNVNKNDSMNIVIVDAAPIGRTYYAGTYSPDNISAPACWSADSKTPAPEVPEDTRQASRCVDCPQNVKGSGQGETRACRYSQRLAVALEGQYDKVYQMQLAATSVFGDAKEGKMPMQAYARFLSAHNTPAVAVVTEMYFDEASSTPKLFFKAVRPLEEQELIKVVELRDTEETKDAITMTVSQTDGVSAKTESKPALFADKPAEKKPEPKAAEPTPSEPVKDEAVEEPKKVATKKTAAPTVDDDDLSSIIDNWDD